jgi:hypothetical protein
LLEVLLSCSSTLLADQNCGYVNAAAAELAREQKNNYGIREQIMGITAVASNQERTKQITVDIQLQDII